MQLLTDTSARSARSLARWAADWVQHLLEGSAILGPWLAPAAPAGEHVKESVSPLPVVHPPAPLGTCRRQTCEQMRSKDRSVRQMIPLCAASADCGWRVGGGGGSGALAERTRNYYGTLLIASDGFGDRIRIEWRNALLNAKWTQPTGPVRTNGERLLLSNYTR